MLAPRRHVFRGACTPLHTTIRTINISHRLRDLPPPPQKKRTNKHVRRLGILLALSAGSIVAYKTFEPFRHATLAVQRCTRLGVAVALGAYDYKRTLGSTYDSKDEEYEALGRCHKRTAERVLKVLQANGGIFIKLVSSLCPDQYIAFNSFAFVRANTLVLFIYSLSNGLRLCDLYKINAYQHHMKILKDYLWQRPANQ